MTGFELLVREFDALQEEVKELRAQLNVLWREREELKEAERRAREKDALMWAYYQAEEAKERALKSEGCRNE